MTAVEQVVAVIDVADVDVVSVIPVVRPVLRPWIHETEPIPPVLEAGKSANNQKGPAIDPETVVWPKGSAEAIFGYAVAVIPATLLPGAVVRFPAF